MPANDFEKNVRKVMDDFKLHPSDEVWQNVEHRIRENKKKRRILLFLFFSVVALSLGGYGLFNWSQHSPLSSSVADHNRASATANSNQHRPAANGSVGTHNLKSTENVKNIDAQNRSLNTNDKLRNVVLNKKRITDRGTEKPNGKWPTTKTWPRQKSITLNNIEPTSSVAPEKTHDQPAVAFDTLATNIPGIVSLHTDHPNSNDAKNNKTAPVDTRTLNIVSDSTSVENKSNESPPVKKPDVKGEAFKNWRWGFNLSLGASTLTQDPFSFKGTTYDYLNAYSSPTTSTGSPGVLYGASPSKPAFSFKAGLDVKKGISPRSSVSTGLEYSYFADKIKIGPNQASTQASSASRLTTYYSAAPQKTYTEHFHFIGLPVIYDWRMTKNEKQSFSLNGGISLTYLFSTDGLVYDTAFHGTYYQDKSAFNRTHFNFLTGISYHVARRNFELATGPQFSFDVTKLIHSDVDKRKYFLFVGIDTRIFFLRKK